MTKQNKIISSIMMEHLNDDNTFSNTDKDFAIIGIHTPTTIKNGVDEIELKKLNREDMIRFIMENELTLENMMGLVPVISIKEKKA